ncbi:MAG: N-acetylmuramic acid 6-phosphate etherase [Myxococcota bacterium]|nr:N-acetylmuramic acid 6-phosphate etherase [Myxococcota bacterium]
MPYPPRRPSPPKTEKLHPHAEDLDLESSLEIVRRLNAEDVLAARAVGKAAKAIVLAADAVAWAIAGGGRLIYVGAGTSGRLGVLDAAECPPTFGTSPSQVVGVIAGGARALRRAVEGAEDDAADGAAQLRKLRVGPRDVVCGITASARTPFVLGALAEARRRKARTVLVCCARPPRGSPAVDVLALADTGPELVAGSTRLKAGTATKLILNAISTTAMIRLGKVYRGRMVDLQSTNAKLRDRASRMISELGAVPEAEATKLLARAKGHPRLAVAMALSGKPAAEASRLEKKAGLRALASTRRR